MWDFFWPQVVEKVKSDFHGEIKVVKFRGKYAVWAGGVEQSGPMVQKLWGDALQGVPLRARQGDALILGLGCGIVAKFLNGKIIGVEIDPEMVRLGKKYFDLSKIKVVNDDAFNYISKNKNKFDLIVCDLYRGNNFPEKLLSDIFLSKLCQKLKNNGLVVFNFLKPQYGNFVRKNFLDKISKCFIVQKRVDTLYNEIYFCSRGKKA